MVKDKKDRGKEWLVKTRGVAHAVFDHSSSIEYLREAVERINNDPRISPDTRYELHHRAESDLERDAGLIDALRTPGDYRVMSKDLRDSYTTENRPLIEHKYVLVARSSDKDHPTTADDLGHVMNQIHLLDDDPRVFRGGIVHQDKEESGYYLK